MEGGGEIYQLYWGGINNNVLCKNEEKGMKKLFPFFISLLFLASVASGQVVIDNFDSTTPDSLYWTAGEGAPSTILFSSNTIDFVEGTGALDIKAIIGAFHPWGSFAQFGYTIPDSLVAWDWSISDSLSIRLKVLTAPTHPEYMVLRVEIKDRPTENADTETYIYENTTIIDVASDWIELKIPLTERETDGSVVPNDEGFVLFPTSWGGGTYNNSKLDRDKIVDWDIGIITTGWTDPDNIPADSVEVSFDSFVRFGTRSIPFVFFNGKTLPSSFGGFDWGASAWEVAEGAGATPNTNAIKWTQGDLWNNGWTGFGYDINPPYNMAGVWATDSIKFKMKAEAGVGPLKVQFEDGTAKVGKVFTPTADNAWHDYVFKLSEFDYQDDTSNFDSSSVKVFGIMAEASAIAGKVVYFDDIWTGDFEIDVVSPEAPTGVNAVPAENYNLVVWQDTPNETGETYTVYASQNPITDLMAPGVDVIANSVLEDVQVFTHWLYFPLMDKEEQYYYAVTCMDEAGNESLTAGVAPSSFNNTSKGIATISLDPPANFVADGDISEWENAGIKPFVITPENNNAYQTVTDSSDLKGTVYLAIDQDYLYFGVDVIDDVYSFGAGNWWDQDAFQFFIGLYDQRGSKHSSLKRGDEPDYEFVFNQNDLNVSGKKIFDAGHDNYFFSDFGGQDYALEAKVPLDSILSGADKRFNPLRGMRIPVEIYFHDNDGSGWEGNLGLSPYSQDNAHKTPTVWTNTWIGDTTAVITAVEMDNNPNMVSTYELGQNYPNPFNPATVIEYSIAKPGLVRIELFNVLGQKLQTLVNSTHEAGKHTLQINANDLTTGIYFYSIQAGDFTQTNKMILMK
jgi:hypothetical protein